MRKELGNTGEELAARYCEAVLGWTIVERNARFKCGEIDLVARDTQEELIFVEVKTRKSTRFGAVEESLTPEKVRRFKRACGEWLRTHRFAAQTRGSHGFKMEFLGLEWKTDAWIFEHFPIE